jgi:putative ABC transport system substrate-binding protein
MKNLWKKTLTFLLFLGLIMSINSSVSAKGKIGVVNYDASSEAYTKPLSVIKSKLISAGYPETSIEVINIEGADKAAKTLNTRQAFEKFNVGNYDVILSSGTDATLIAKEVIKTKPIVFFSVADPVGAGLVTSLIETKSNITGASSKISATKAAQVFFDTAPTVKKLGVLTQAGSKAGLADIEEIKAIKNRVGLEVVTFEIKDDADLTARADEIAKSADGFFLPGQSLFSSKGKVFIDAANLNKKPTIVLKDYMVSKWGATVGVYPNLTEVGDKTALMVKAILEGKTPSQIPVYVPQNYPIIVNNKKAVELGIEVPEKVLSAAEQVIDE